MGGGAFSRVSVAADAKINHIIRSIESAPGTVIVLDIPGPAPVLESAANIKLLQYYAERSGKELRVCTREPQLRELMAQYGINQAETTESVNTSAQTGKQIGFRPRWYHLAVIPLLIIGLAYLSYYAPEPATIKIVPEVTPYSGEIILAVRDLETTTVTANFTVADELASSGRTVEPLTPAQGTIILINDSAKAIKVPKGTRVSTSGGQVYTTLAAVTVPARETDYFHDIPVGVRAGQAEVRVEAAQKGTRGNIAANRIVSIDGFAELKVVNPEPISGGQDRSLAVVTQADLDLLLERLTAQAAVQAESELDLIIPTDEVMLSPLVTWELTEVQLKPDPGQQAGLVQGKAIVTSSVVCVDSEVLAEQASQLVSARLGGSPVRLAEADVQVMKIDAEAVTCQVSGVLVSEVSATELVALIAGEPVDEAASLLATQPGVAAVEVEAGERSKLPRNKQYIQVQVMAEPALAVSGEL